MIRGNDGDLEKLVGAGFEDRALLLERVLKALLLEMCIHQPGQRPATTLSQKRLQQMIDSDPPLWLEVRTSRDGPCLHMSLDPPIATATPKPAAPTRAT
jgi:hypothetical protein